MSFIMITILILLIAPLTNLVHELSHAAAAKLSGADNILVEIGVGRKLFQINVGGISLSMNAWVFWGGFSTNESSIRIAMWKQAIIAISGPAGNLLLIYVLLQISSFHDSLFVHVFILFNGWVGFLNLLPYKISGRASDGYVFISMLYHAIRNH